METGLAGKRVLVTGASGGIGAACAREFAAEGCEIVAHYNRGVDRAEALAAELRNVQLVPADLTDEEDVDSLFAAAGPLDVCAAVAGVWPRDDVPVWELPLARWPVRRGRARRLCRGEVRNRPRAPAVAQERDRPRRATGARERRRAGLDGVADDTRARRRRGGATDLADDGASKGGAPGGRRPAGRRAGVRRAVGPR